MATQHPDNASAPYWERDGDGFVSVHEELDECVSAWRDLGVGEFMWDFEGKYADEAVIDRLFSTHHAFCQEEQIGRDRLLTFRLPNPWHEPAYSLPRALMVILTSQDFARDLGFHPTPLFEVILPMTERADQLIFIQRAFQTLAAAKYQAFAQKKNGKYLEVIPLIEGAIAQQGVGKLLARYAVLHKKYFKKPPEYIRPFLARSDPALISGLLATVIGNAIALSEIAAFSKETKIPTFPILGVGSLVFRGGLTPDNIPQFLHQYAGVRTVTIQSAFRYDYPLPQVKKAIGVLGKNLPKTKPRSLSASALRELPRLTKRAERLYQETLPGLLPRLQPIFASVPKRRERRLHIGLLGYGRKVGQSVLPRAITFTAGCYSLGTPPEFFGTGRMLTQMTDRERSLLDIAYPNLTSDLERAGRYLNREMVERLAKHDKPWRAVLEDIHARESTLGISFGPKTAAEQLHYGLTTQIYEARQNPLTLTRLITEAGILRRSLG